MTFVQIRRIGSYLSVDDRGYIQSQATAANITGDWLMASQLLVKAYVETWGEAIHSVYIRGSLAKGLAVAGVSDIDSFAVLAPEQVQTAFYETFGNWAQEVESTIQKAFPFVAGVELGLETFESVHERDNIYAFIIKTEAACVYGPDLTERIAPFQLNPDVAFQTRYFERHLEQFQTEYPGESEADKPGYLVWLMRRFLRLGMELVMVDQQRYTRDLYLCYESFAEHYPEQAAPMYRALELAVNPETGESTESFVRTFGDWLTAEARRKLTGWVYRKDAEGDWARGR